MINILQKKVNYFLFLIFFLSFIFFAKNVSYAVTVTSFEINPSSPTYNSLFDCVIGLDIDYSNIACGLRPLGSNQKPWDICPKKGETGHRYTENNKRYYKCIANSETNVPIPGKYEIVTWEFWADGAEGKALFSKEINIINQPPPTTAPTATPRPTSTPIPTRNFILEIPRSTPTSSEVAPNPVNEINPSAEAENYPEPQNNINFDSSFNFTDYFLKMQKNILTDSLSRGNNFVDNTSSLINNNISNLANEINKVLINLNIPHTNLINLPILDYLLNASWQQEELL